MDTLELTWRAHVDTGDPKFSRHIVEADFGYGWMEVGVIHETLADGEPAHFRACRLHYGEERHLTITSNWTDAVFAILSGL